MDNNELIHYGTKGMKWGVRRYQNKDGTLTSAGKKRKRASYASEAREMTDQELRSKIDRMNLEKRYMNMAKGDSEFSRKLSTVNKITRATAEGGKVNKDVKNLKGQSQSRADTMSKGLNAANKSAALLKKVDNVVTEHKTVKRNKARLESMSDAELRETVNRMNLEQQYVNLKRENVNRGRLDAMDVLDVAGDVLAVAASATALAVSIKTLRSGK